MSEKGLPGAVGSQFALGTPGEGLGARTSVSLHLDRRRLTVSLGGVPGRFDGQTVSGTMDGTDCTGTFQGQRTS